MQRRDPRTLNDATLINEINRAQRWTAETAELMRNTSAHRTGGTERAEADYQARNYLHALLAEQERRTREGKFNPRAAEEAFKAAFSATTFFKKK